MLIRCSRAQLAMVALKPAYTIRAGIRQFGNETSIQQVDVSGCILVMLFGIAFVIAANVDSP